MTMDYTKIIKDIENNKNIDSSQMIEHIHESPKGSKMQKALAIFAATAAALTFAMAVSPTVQNLSGAYFSPNSVAACVVEATHVTKVLSMKIDKDLDKLNSRWSYESSVKDVQHLKDDTYYAKNLLMGVVKPIFENSPYKYNSKIDAENPDQADFAIYQKACSTMSYRKTVEDAKFKLDNIENIQTLHAETFKKTQYKSISLKVDRGEMFKNSAGTADRDANDPVVPTTLITYRR